MPAAWSPSSIISACRRTRIMSPLLHLHTTVPEPNPSGPLVNCSSGPIAARHSRTLESGRRVVCLRTAARRLLCELVIRSRRHALAHLQAHHQICSLPTSWGIELPVQGSISRVAPTALMSVRAFPCDTLSVREHRDSCAPCPAPTNLR